MAPASLAATGAATRFPVVRAEPRLAAGVVSDELISVDPDRCNAAAGRLASGFYAAVLVVITAPFRR
jgi:hypothetical protein